MKLLMILFLDENIQIIEIAIITIVVRAFYHENKKYYAQVF